MENAITQLAGSPVEVESTAESRSGQFNLFTGEVEPVPGMGELEPQPETPWLFDPDFGLVLPEDRAGKEILVEEGIALSFPAESKGTGYRSRGTGRTNENRQSQTCPERSERIENPSGAITNRTSPIANPSGAIENRQLQIEKRYWTTGFLLIDAAERNRSRKTAKGGACEQPRPNRPKASSRFTARGRRFCQVPA
jgi:hypothetical protein